MSETSDTQSSGAQARVSPIPPPSQLQGTSFNEPIDVDGTDIEVTSKPPRQRAAAWSGFTPLPDQEKVQCVHCGDKLTHKANGSTGTSNMTRHLDVCSKKRKLESGQQQLSFGFVKMSFENKMKIHALLEKWVIRDQHSLSVVDHPDFRALLAALSPDYECPTRNILTRRISKDFFELKQQVKTLLATVPGRIALTTDAWTAGNGHQFQSVTGHFIDKNWELKTLILDFVPFPVPHTAENAANLISAVLRELDIETKLSSCVTDNTASAYNISTILGRRIAPSPFLPGRCAAHLINLVVKHGLDDSGRDEIFAKCRAFVTLLHRSKPTEKALRSSCEAVGIKYVVPPTVMEVRWNSTLAQLKVLERLEPALRNLFGSTHAEYAWSEPVWLAVRDIIKILTIFKDVSDHLQGRSFPTISSAAEGFVIMSKSLEELQGAGALTAWGTEVLKLFQTRLTEYREHLIDSDLVQWATILDPTMKGNVIRKDGVHSLDYVASELEFHLSMHYPISTVPAATSDSGSIAKSEYEKRRQKLDLSSDPSTTTTINAQSQLRTYLDEATLVSSSPSDALKYWSMNEKRFPSLAAIARDLLAIPATSVPSEAAFSRGGEVITKRRNRLLGKTVTHIMCLDSWMAMGAAFSTVKAFSEDDMVE